MFRNWVQVTRWTGKNLVRLIGTSTGCYMRSFSLNRNFGGMLENFEAEGKLIIGNRVLRDVEKNILLDIANPGFDPIKFSILRTSDHLTFAFLADIFEKISEAKGKDSKLAQKIIFCNFFRLINVYFPKDLIIGVNLCSGKICPDYLQEETGIGDSTLNKLVTTLSGQSKKEIKLLEDKIGDLSLVAFQVHKSISQHFSIYLVHKILSSLTSVHGLNSSNKKEEILYQLFKSSSSLELKYLIRLLQKTLRIGASELTVIDSLASAIEKTPPNQDFPHKSFEISGVLKEILSKIVKICPDFSQIAGELTQISINSDYKPLLSSCKPRIGSPIQPMSAHPVSDLKELISRFKDKRITCEYKYDGIRGQVHLNSNGEVFIFSRGRENITGSYPEIADFIKSSLKSHVKNCILDCEIVPIDTKNNTLQPFSSIQSRKKKYNENEQAKVPVCLFLFDLLLLNDCSIINKNLELRRKSLAESFTEIKGKIEFVQYKDIECFSEVEQVLADAVSRGCEGLMVKQLNEGSEYEPGIRSFNWLKLKKDYLSSNFASKLLPDTLDLVPIGAFLGSGKRKGLFGSFLLACYDHKNSEFQTVCKLGTGFSDQFLIAQTQSLKKFQTSEPLQNIRYKVKPDIWLNPQIVWEIQAADLSISPTHTSAWGSVIKDKGISVRFPRFVKERPDKSMNELTTSDQIFSLYQNQILITKN